MPKFKRKSNVKQAILVEELVSVCGIERTRTMSSWNFGKVEYFPKLVAPFLSLGTILPLFISIWREDVSPYMPYISEAGAKSPSSHIFSICTCIMSFFGSLSIVLRYALIEIRNKSGDSSVHRWNVASTIAGLLSMLAIVFVSVFNVLDKKTMHFGSAIFVLVGSQVFMCVQTWFDYSFYAPYISRFTLRLRMTLMISAWIAGITSVAFIIVGFSSYEVRDASLWAGKKLPGEKGFVPLFISSIGEWIHCLCFGIYYTSFMTEFKNVKIQVTENATTQYQETNGHANSKLE